jgi:hypothetical protein
MIEPNHDDPAFRRFNAIVTLALALGVAGVAYAYERQRRAWWGENRLGAPLIAGFRRTGHRMGRFGENVRDLSETLGNVSAAARPRTDAEGHAIPAAPGGAAHMRSGVSGTVKAARSRDAIKRAARVRAQAERAARAERRRHTR